ncbi:ribonuclease H-like domain-containing protein [Tanacetum coccineum]
MQSRTSLSYKAHPYSVSLHKGTGCAQNIPSEYEGNHYEDGNPARAYIKTSSDGDGDTVFQQNQVQKNRGAHFSNELFRRYMKAQVSVELNKKKGKGIGQGDNRLVWNNVQRLNHQNQFVPTAVLTRTGRILVNTASHNFNSQADNPQRALKNKGIVDSGCSKHMTRNKAYLVEYQDYNGSPVAFGGCKGYITGKGKIKTRKLDFEDVCFVKELQHFNLFSVSQMCDKKNKVLFTDTECLVLSSDFKLPDENQVLLRIPRQNNMYSFNIENIVPSGGLACLIAKATIDESNKWHRRLGHVNFKNLNKLVKGNLVFPVRSENQANKTTGPKEVNHSAGTQDNIDAGNSKMEAESAHDYFVMPIWSSYTSTVKSSEAKNEGEKPNKNTGLKTNEEPVDQEDQAFLEELERLKRQEKEANDAAEALRKEFAKDTEDLLLQAGAARATSTNTVNTTSTLVSIVSPSSGLSYPDLTHTDQDDSQIPALEDIYNNPNNGIFTNASYDDEGAVTDFTNLETIVNVSPIPTSRIHSIHPSTQLLGDPKSALQTRSKVNKSSGAHAFKISEVLKDESWIDVDALFVAKLQQEEREEYTVKERAKFLAETIAAQRKFRAAQRSAEIRSRAPTKSQLRNLMMTYLKNMGGYKHSQLKVKTFAEIQGLYKRQKRVIDDFKPMDSDDAVKISKEAPGVHKQKVLKEPNSTKVEVKREGHEESIRKRPGRRLKMKATKKSKRQKTDADLEEEEQLKAFLKIVPDEEGIIDYEVLEKRFPIINWESKFYDFDRHGADCIYYRIFRSDGSSRRIKTFSEMVTRFEMLDLMELYNLVMKRFETTTLEGVDLDLYENCGVHTLILEDGTEIHMLVERKYSLIKETLKRMLSLWLVAGTASEDAYTLLRFIQKQIDEYGSHDGGEKDL